MDWITLVCEEVSGSGRVSSVGSAGSEGVGEAQYRLMEKTYSRAGSNPAWVFLIQGSNNWGYFKVLRSVSIGMRPLTLSECGDVLDALVKHLHFLKYQKLPAYPQISRISEAAGPGRPPRSEAPAHWQPKRQV